MTPDISARRVGAQREPVAIVDGFHPDPDELRAAAARVSFELARHHYPGVRAPLPADYVAHTQAVIATVLREVFGHAEGAGLIDASFSIVTTPPDALTLQQRLPHVDATARERIALVHYLDPAGGDGTAFYRHRATGFETVDGGRESTYFPVLDRQLRDSGEPAPAYIAGDTPLFERTALVEARYNRAVIYRSAMLHSGAIAPGAALSADPAIGRLTVTAFLAGR
jgi:hypothetical protein